MVQNIIPVAFGSLELSFENYSAQVWVLGTAAVGGVGGVEDPNLYEGYFLHFSSFVWWTDRPGLLRGLLKFLA